VRVKKLAGPARRGYLLVELSMATMLLAVAMVLTVQLLGWTASERRAVERHERAVQEAANLMERLTALPWDRATPEAAAAVQLSPSSRQALPGCELTASVVSLGTDPPAKRIRVLIRWRNRSGVFEAPVRLTAWIYRSGRAQP
jgi:hypothetical protein